MAGLPCDDDCEDDCAADVGDDDNGDASDDAVTEEGPGGPAIGTGHMMS